MKLFCKSILGLLLLVASTVQAAIIIDPDGVGATAVVPSDPSTWTSGTNVRIGLEENGTLTINNDGNTVINSEFCLIGGRSASYPDAVGKLNISGTGAGWNVSHDLQTGSYGVGELNISDGGTINIAGYASVARFANSSGTVNVYGAGSKWTSLSAAVIGHTGSGTMNVYDGGVMSMANGSNLQVGYGGTSRLNITEGGLVDVAGSLGIGANGLISMSTGGMLALSGEWDYSLNTFFGAIISNYQNFQYWDNTSGGWALLSTAPTSEYTLEYVLDGGDLDGYTVLTVGTAVPEPSSVVLLITALLVTCFTCIAKTRSKK